MCTIKRPLDVSGSRCVIDLEFAATGRTGSVEKVCLNQQRRNHTRTAHHALNEDLSREYQRLLPT